MQGEFILSGQKVERRNNGGEVRFELSVEISQNREGSYGFNTGRGTPGLDGVEFLWVHLNSSLTDNYP